MKKNTMTHFRTKVSTALVLISLSAASASAFSSPISADGLLSKLTDHCDASLFSYLKQNAAAATALAPVYIKDDFLFFKVKNRKSTGNDSIVNFTTPLNASGLEITGYTDQYTNLGKDGRYYNWGFVVKGNPTDVIKKLPASIASQLRQDGDIFVKAEWKPSKDDAASWRAGTNTPSGEPPKPGTIERLLMLEATSTKETLIICSLQGTVTQDILKAHRPDLYDEMYSDKISVQKWIIVTGLIKNFQMGRLFNSNEEKQKILQDTISALKKKNPTYPLAYWQELTEIQNNFLEDVARDEPENEKKLRALIALLMVNAMDIDQLKDTPPEQSPIVTLVTNNIMSVEQLVQLKGEFQYGAALRKREEAVKKLKERYDLVSEK